MDEFDLEDRLSKENDIEYKTGFLAGYNFNIMIDDEGEVIELNESSLYSIGYRDGQNYAEYCKMVGLDKVFDYEKLEAQIGRAYSQSFSKFREYQLKYQDYKKGFLNGRCEFLKRVLNSENKLEEPTTVSEEDYEKLGYYDGYISCLDNNQTNINHTDDELEPIISESFKNRNKSKREIAK